MNRILVLLMLIIGCGIGCGRRTGASSGMAAIGAANSYLECAARDVMGNDAVFVRLAEPGTCPGHFDLRPSQALELNRCRALLRFDFQKALDARIDAASTNRPVVMDVRIDGGMCEWTSYTNACGQIADALVSAGLLDRARAEDRLRIIGARMDGLAGDMKAQIVQAGLTHSPVLASAHQKAFCASLGLQVAAVFRASDAARMSEVDQAIEAALKAGVKTVIANRPEGVRLAGALAERVGGKAVVFDNFPDPSLGEAAFDAMVRANVRALLEAAR